MRKAFAATDDESVRIFARDAAAGNVPVCVVCGGRNAGKSRLACRLVQEALHARHAHDRTRAAEVSSSVRRATGRGVGREEDVQAEVAYLETDCGQTQFSMPGVLALYVIRHEQLCETRPGGGGGRAEDVRMDDATTRSENDDAKEEAGGRCGEVLPRLHLRPSAGRFFGALSPKVRR